MEADRPSIATLAQIAAAGLRSRRGGPGALPIWFPSADTHNALRDVEHHLESSEHCFFVLESARGVAGASVAWIDGEVGWFAVFVDDEMRHRGHGPALAAEALRWLDAHDEVRHIDALALPGDRAMKSLLEKAGFKARLLTMRRSN
jgi:RimJ/RimL family protein N-acetyltransferase